MSDPFIHSKPIDLTTHCSILLHKLIIKLIFEINYSVILI